MEGGRIRKGKNLVRGEETMEPRDAMEEAGRECRGEGEGGPRACACFHLAMVLLLCSSKLLTLGQYVGSGKAVT